MNLTGFVPSIGAAKDVAVSGNYAYVASAEFGLAIADISNPADIVPVGGANPPFYAERVAVAGNLAVLTGNSAGFFVVDVTTKTAPVKVGFLPGVYKGCAINGTKAYAIQVVPGNPPQNDVVVIDLAVPSAPVIVGRINVIGGAELCHAGTHIYVAAVSLGVKVVNVATPTAPSVVATLVTPGIAKDVAASSGNVLYVAGSTALHVVDITTPATPVLRGSLTTTAKSVTANGVTAYVGDGGLNLKVVNAANQTAPTLSSTTPGYGSESMTVVGTTVYLASPDVNATTQKGGLYTINAANPAAPVKQDNLYGGFDHWSLSVSGTIGVVMGTLGLKVIDVSTPSAPSVVATMTGTWKGGCIRLGNYVFASLMTPGNPATCEFVSINLTTPASPTIVHRQPMPTPISMATVGSLVGVAAGSTGMILYDVSNPALPVKVSTFPLGGSAQDIVMAGGVACVAGTGAVYVVSIAFTSAPTLLSTLAIPAIRLGFDANRSRLYVLGGAPISMLRIVSLSNPRTPVVQSTSPSYAAQSIAIPGSTIVLATPALNHFDPTGGLFVINCTNPAAPAFVERIEVPGITRAVTASGAFVYAGDVAAIMDVVA